MLNLNISLESKKWLVIGGGTVATRRVKKILKEEGHVRLISPVVSKPLLKIESQNKNLKIVKRKFRKSDIGNQDFVLACTDSVRVNRDIVATAKSKKILVSNASDKNDSEFSFTSTININRDIRINLSTDGKNPSFTKTLRIYFEKNLKGKILSLYKNRKKSIR
ncbi:hypothetical protein HN460_01330 [bacterium]|mgnify:FL=1|jgi:siroheme synthase-like protein|nr:hypothetical protein [bacterium]MBT3795860.1 hypothetical protein [bacterium]MBT4634342.1 hypothetical protein [bacterium]